MRRYCLVALDLNGKNRVGTKKRFLKYLKINKATNEQFNFHHFFGPGLDYKCTLSYIISRSSKSKTVFAGHKTWKKMKKMRKFAYVIVVC